MTLEVVIEIEQIVDRPLKGVRSLLFSVRMISPLVRHVSGCIIVSQRCRFSPSRLETRTKESNLYASTRV